MKRTLAFIFLIVITTSCMMPKYAVYSGMLDFKKYNDRGFLLHNLIPYPLNMIQ